MSFDACAEMVRVGDPDRYHSVMAAPVSARDRLFALYAFNLEVARAPWVTSEEMIAEMRLQWWIDTINEIYDGKAQSHEVVGPMASVIVSHNLPQHLFIELIEARRFDIYREGHSNVSNFSVYINATSGNLMRLAAVSLGAEDMPHLADFGFGVGVANLFRALPTLYANGKNPIYVEGTLDRNAVTGREVPVNLAVSLQAIAAEAVAKIKSARKLRNQTPKSAIPAMLAGWQADVPLKMVISDPKSVLLQPLETSEFRKKSDLLWRSLTGRW